MSYCSSRNSEVLVAAAESDQCLILTTFLPPSRKERKPCSHQLFLWAAWFPTLTPSWLPTVSPLCSKKPQDPHSFQFSPFFLSEEKLLRSHGSGGRQGSALWSGWGAAGHGAPPPAIVAPPGGCGGRTPQHSPALRSTAQRNAVPRTPSAVEGWVGAPSSVLQCKAGHLFMVLLWKSKLCLSGTFGAVKYGLWDKNMKSNGLLLA